MILIFAKSDHTKEIERGELLHENDSTFKVHTSSKNWDKKSYIYKRLI